uniref:Replication factor A C-terminal domain-containing protein n=1 Tax=Chenopodium quinoa TaxID=63459 RepID=A0A803M837_CHEQI
GNRMRGTLFGDQIQAFEEALRYLVEYDISIAPIRFIDEKWRTELDQFPYQMTFGSRAVIQPVHPELGPVLPNYQLIATIPRAIVPDERYGRKNLGELKLEMEDEKACCDQPLTISLWNDLTAPRYFDRLQNWAETFQAIGFRATKPHTRRAKQHLIQNAELEKVNAYPGCSNCWNRTNLPLQKRYSCSACSKKECICTERATFKFEASDDTGTMAFTTFNNDTERLFRKTAAEIYAIKEARSSEKNVQEETFAETPESPQQTSESLKRKKSSGKSPMEYGAEENVSELPLSEIGAKKKLCFGGMTPKKHNRGQNPRISLGKDHYEDVSDTLEPEQKQSTPVIVKTENVKKSSTESNTKAN